MTEKPKLPKRDPSNKQVPFVDTDGPTKITPEDLAQVHRTLQAAYLSLRDENKRLLKFAKGTFKKHPLKRKGRGWIWHYCREECFRKEDYDRKKWFVHRVERDGDGDWL